MKIPVIGNIVAKFKKKELFIRTNDALVASFVTSDITKINIALEKFGIKIGEKQNTSMMPYVLVEGLKPETEFSKVVPLFDKKNKQAIVLHIRPNASNIFIIKNERGEIINSIRFNAGDVTEIIRIEGSENNFTMEGQLDV